MTEILLVAAAGRFSRNPSDALRRLADADPRIRLPDTRSPTAGTALNAASALARGEFVVFLRDTQLVPPRAFSRQLATLQNSGSDFAVGAMDHVRDGRPSRPALARALHWRDRLGVTLPDEPDVLIDVELGNVMFRTDFWRSHPGFDTVLARPEQPAMIAAYLSARSFDMLAISTGRNRLRPNLTSIVQERFSTVEVSAARRAATASWSLLARADPQARTAWLAGLLDGQLGGYLDKASLGDDAFRQALAAFIRDVGAVASEPVDGAAWAHVRVHRRVQLWLAEQGRWPEVDELVEWVRLFGAVPPTHLNGNRVVGDFPIAEHWQLPDDLRELAAIETHFDGALQHVHWTEDGLLLIRGWALIRGVGMDRYPLHLEAELREAETGQVVALSPVLEHLDAANRWARQRYADAAPGGFVLLIDPADLPVSPGPDRTTHWQLRLRLRVGELERSGPLTTAVREGVDLNIPAQDLSEDLSRGGPPYRIVPMRTPALGFCLQRRRERLQVVALAVAGRRVSGTIAVLDQRSAPPPRIRAFLDQGRVADLTADLVPNADGQLDFELTLPSEAPAGRWDIRILNRAGQQTWLPWGNDAELGHRLSEPGGTLAWQRTTRGFTSLVTDAAEVEARATSVTEHQLQVEVRAFGISGAELETAVLRGPISSVSLDSVVALGEQPDPREGASDWLLTFSTHARRWGGPVLPLVSGNYTVVLPQRDLLVVPARSLLGELPASGSTGIHGWTVLRAGSQNALVIRFRPPLTEAEQSLNGRTRIRDQWLRTEFTPRHAVLFQCFRGEFATDSQRALHEELRRRGSDLELIWAVKDHAVALPEGAVPVIIDSTEWYDAVGSARYLCQNIDYDRWFVRREHQRYLQTFHGYPFKSMGASLWRSQGKSERAIADGCRRRNESWDAILLPDQQTTELYRSEYRYQGEVLICGYPRDDSLLAADAEDVRQRTRALLGLKPGQHAVLYAPTWRDTAATGAWTAQMFDELDLDELTRALGPDYVVLVRGHNYVLRGGGSSLAADVLDVTSYPEVNDLILAADVAVLDYSSLRFDWMLTEKPVLFFVPDLADYLSARTSLFDFASTAPGPLLSTTAEVTRALQTIDQTDAGYAAARKAFNRRFQPLNDGHAAARVVDQFFS